MHPFGMYLAITDSQREHGWVAARGAARRVRTSRRRADRRARTRVPDRTPGRDRAATRHAGRPAPDPLRRAPTTMLGVARGHGRAHDRGCAPPRLESDLRRPRRRASGPVRGARARRRRSARHRRSSVARRASARAGSSTEVTTLSAAMGVTAVGGHVRRMWPRGRSRTRPSSISSVTSTAPDRRRRCPRQRVPSSDVSFPRSPRTLVIDQMPARVARAGCSRPFATSWRSRRRRGRSW